MKERLVLAACVLLIVGFLAAFVWGVITLTDCVSNGGTWVPTGWPRKCVL